MIKNQLQLLQTEFTTLKEKIRSKLQALNESNRKLELLSKENSENEQVLEILLREFKELGEEL